MPYVEFPPRPDLAHIVKCVWNYEAAADETWARPERIVPDGNPELVEADLDYWINTVGRFCPWSSIVVEER